MRGKLLAVAFLCLLGGSSRGEDEASLSVHAETRRIYLSITVDGKSKPGETTGLARVRRGERTALERAFAPERDGSFHVEIRTTARLLPDEYSLEVVALPGSRTTTSTFRIGKPDEVEPARASLRRWLLDARRTLRGLWTTLERRGRYHGAAIDLWNDEHRFIGRTEGQLAQRAAWKAALEKFDARLRAARMDFAEYDREVLLSPFPEASGAFEAVFAQLAKRRGELDRAIDQLIESREGMPEPCIEMRALALRALRAIDERAPDDAADWEPDPLLCRPEALIFHLQSGKQSFRTSPLGFGLAVPDEWIDLGARQIAPSTDNSLERVHLDGPEGCHALVRVRELPDATSIPELFRIAEVLTFEEQGERSYKKTSSTDGPGERYHRIDATVGDGAATRRLVVVDYAPPSGKRLFELVLVFPGSSSDARRAEVETLASSFGPAEGK